MAENCSSLGILNHPKPDREGGPSRELFTSVSDIPRVIPTEYPCTMGNIVLKVHEEHWIIVVCLDIVEENRQH